MDPSINTEKVHWQRHVVLVTPEIHWNTGNVGRTCLGARASLHLIKPLGFSLDDKSVKRAGLDYWNRVNLNVWEDFDSFSAKMKMKKDEVALFTKTAKRSFYNLKRLERLFLIFGSETQGLPTEIFNRFPNECYHIPISSAIRCLNLSTAVGIALYESIRDFSPINDWSSTPDSSASETS